MKNKIFKKFVVVVALVAVCGFTTGCGSSGVNDLLNQVAEQAEPAEATESAQESQEAEPEVSQEAEPVVEPEATQEAEPVAEPEATQEAESAVEPEVTQEAEPEVEPEAESTEVPEEAQEQTEENADTEEVPADLTGNWGDMQFVLDGQMFRLPVAYKDLEAAGWSFNLADYGYADGYAMNPGDKVFATIELTNPNYSDKLTVHVGFINNGEGVLDIMECDVWSFEMDTCYAFKQVDSFPGMTIGNGLTWGDTREEVEAACGPCDDIYESTDHGYAVYSYNIDFTYYLKVTIYDEFGITAFELSTYE